MAKTAALPGIHLPERFAGGPSGAVRTAVPGTGHGARGGANDGDDRSAGVMPCCASATGAAEMTGCRGEQALNGQDDVVQAAPGGSLAGDLGAELHGAAVETAMARSRDMSPPAGPLRFRGCQLTRVTRT